jgi:hypothetical protein
MPENFNKERHWVTTTDYCSSLNLVAAGLQVEESKATEDDRYLVYIFERGNTEPLTV